MKAEWTKQLADLHEMVGKQNVRIKALEQEVEALKQGAETLKQQPEEKPQPAAAGELTEPAAMQPQAARNLQTYYLPAPTADGIFPTASLSEQMGTSIYQMTTDDGRNGRFIMLSTPDAIATAMISVSQFVKPVCRVEGNTHRLPRNIETLEEGTVKRDGSVWKVQQKAIVRFS